MPPRRWFFSLHSTTMAQEVLPQMEPERSAANLAERGSKGKSAEALHSGGEGRLAPPPGRAGARFNSLGTRPAAAYRLLPRAQAMLRERCGRLPPPPAPEASRPGTN